MKIRTGFVSNSSSTSFVITNLTDTEKTIVDFLVENSYLVNEFNESYSYEYTLEEALDSAKNDYHSVLKPNQDTVIAFGDEDGTVLGDIFDYILRDGGKSKSFSWRFDEYLR